MNTRIAATSRQTVTVQNASRDLRTFAPKQPSARCVWRCEPIACQMKAGKNQAERSRRRVMEAICELEIFVLI